jgi:hypothetical protein
LQVIGSCPVSGKRRVAKAVSNATATALLGVYGKLLSAIIRIFRILLRIAQEFKKRLQIQDLDGFINELPESWLITNDDATALKEYLMYRLGHLDEICTIITGR